MLIRVLQAGHNTFVFSSGMIRKLASANRLLRKTLIGYAEFLCRENRRACCIAQ